MNFLKSLFCLIVFFAGVEAHSFMVDLGLTQFSQSFTQTAESKSSQTFFSLGLLADISKGDSAVNFGWLILSSSTKLQSAGSEEKFSSLDMGPALRWGIDQKRLFSVMLAYGVYAKGKYETAGSSENLTGTSLFFKFAVEPQVTDTIRLGVSLNYYNPTYNKSVLNSTESDVSYKGTQLFPALSMSFKF